MFKLPMEIIEGIPEYEKSLEDFIKGKSSSARFKGIRVPWGIYSERGGVSNMARIRIPAGVVSPEQLNAIAFVALKYGRSKLHITTRQDIQIHGIKIEDTVSILEYLKGFELSSRGGGGNTVRNITSCPEAGICKEELFNVNLYAIALSEYLLKEENSFNLPRKYKIAFSGCPKDCGGVLVNDLGFLAMKNNEEIGFRIYVGGGMGAKPQLGQLLEEFLPVTHIGYCAKAIRNIFWSYGNRKDRHHNRLRFLIDNLGFQRFKEFYLEEYNKLAGSDRGTLKQIEGNHEDRISGVVLKNEDKEYNSFLRYNARPQKQEGFYYVKLRVPQGDIEAQNLMSLADLEKDFKGIEFRASQNQNLLITWVSAKDLYPLHLKLNEILGDSYLYPEMLSDIVVCKGASTCNLGLCNSPALSPILESIILGDFVGKEVFEKLNIKISGCPNSCGQHPIGDISFHGMVKKHENRPVPFYKVLLGGKKSAEDTKLAFDVGAVPAKALHLFLKDFLSCAEKVLSQGIGTDVFIKENARDIALGLIEKYAAIPSYSENPDYYKDWGKTEDFSLAGIGPGECGAGVLDMIESDLLDAKKSLDSGTFEDLYKALIFLARALLVTFGIETLVDSEILTAFKSKVVDTRIISEKYAGILDFTFKLLKKDINHDEAFSYIKGLYDEISLAYKNMDSELKFPVKIVENKKEKEEQSYIYDLRGVLCPMNYVKAKVKLSSLKFGDKLTIYLDPGEPCENVPVTLKNDGQIIEKIEDKGDYFEVVVLKQK